MATFLWQGTDDGGKSTTNGLVEERQDASQPGAMRREEGAKPSLPRNCVRNAICQRHLRGVPNPCEPGSHRLQFGHDKPIVEVIVSGQNIHAALRW